MELSIIIVNYNGGNLVLECLRSLEQNPPNGQFEIILIDNASIDDSASTIEKQFPYVKVTRCKENIGLTKGFNLGVRKSSGRHLLSLDNDTVVFPDSINHMVDFLNHRSDAGAVGCALIYPDGTTQQTARRFPSPMNALFGRRSLMTRWFPANRFSRRYLMNDFDDETVPFEVDTLSTACMLVRHEVIDSVGAYDEQFFVYWSDTDWCYRIKEKKWKIFSLPDSEVIHNENIKAKHRTGRRVKMIIDFHTGAYRFYRKHYIHSTWNPMNLVAIMGLSGRAAVLILSDEMRRLVVR